MFDCNGINKTKPLSHKNDTHEFTVSWVYRNLKHFGIVAMQGGCVGVIYITVKLKKT